MNSSTPQNRPPFLAGEKPAIQSAFAQLWNMIESLNRKYSELLNMVSAINVEASSTVGATGPQGIQGATGPAGSANINGTSGKIIKFTGPITGGNSIISESGTEITVAGSHVVTGISKTQSGIIAKTKRIVFADSPYTCLASDETLFCDTDGGAITVNLPAGVNGTKYKIINCGTSGNTVALTPNGTEQLFKGGAGLATTLYDEEIADIIFETTEGWL